MAANNSENTRKNKIEALVLSAENNDKYAFVELVGIFSPYITYLANSFNVSSEFDDICQEGRIALYQAVRSYDSSKSSFTTFARICIKNAMTSFIRTYSNETKKALWNISLDDVDTDVLASDSVQTPEETFMAAEFVKDLENAVNTVLSEAERQVIRCRLSGIGAAETSVIVGKDIKYVENSLFRARKKLKKYLENKK